jgi:K+-transporting ATPase KdpF subunit
MTDMSLLYLLMGVLAAFLFVYLLIALLKPELFP